jgi:hypothetical protein
MHSPIPNTGLMREIIAVIEADPEHFDPARFASQDPDGVLRFDFGGRTIIHRHPKAVWRWKPDFQRPGWMLATAVDPRSSPRPAGKSAYYLTMELLNIGFDTARALFADDIDIPKLRALVDQLCATVDVA